MGDLHRARKHLEIILNLILLEEYHEAQRQISHLHGLEMLPEVPSVVSHLESRNF